MSLQKAKNQFIIHRVSGKFFNKTNIKCSKVDLWICCPSLQGLECEQCSAATWIWIFSLLMLINATMCSATIWHLFKQDPLIKELWCGNWFSATSLKVSSRQKQPFRMFCDELDSYLIDIWSVFCAKFDLYQNKFLQI